MVSGGQYFIVQGGAGTTVVTNHTTVLQRVVFGGSYVGTLKIDDAASATGTTGSSQIISLGIPLAAYPSSINIGAQCRNGILIQATGAPVMTLVFGDGA